MFPKCYFWSGEIWFGRKSNPFREAWEWVGKALDLTTMFLLHLKTTNLVPACTTHILNTKIHKFKYLGIFLLDLKTSKYGCLHNTNSYNITKYHNIHLGKYVFEGNQCNIARKENQIGSWGVTCWMNTWIWNYLIVKPFVLLLEDMRKGEKVKSDWLLGGNLLKWRRKRIK